MEEKNVSSVVEPVESDDISAESQKITEGNGNKPESCNNNGGGSGSTQETDPTSGAESDYIVGSSEEVLEKKDTPPHSCPTENIKQKQSEYSEYRVGETRTIYTENGKSTTHYPRYLGLSVLFLLLLAIYGMIQFANYNKKVSYIANNMSSINRRMSGINLEIEKMDASVNGYENLVVTLDLRKTLLTLDGLIKRADDPSTQTAATRAKQSIISLLKTMNAFEGITEPPIGINLDINSGFGVETFQR